MFGLHITRTKYMRYANNFLIQAFIAHIHLFGTGILDFAIWSYKKLLESFILFSFTNLCFSVDRKTLMTV